ncbi:uncharacterized protein LOC111716238, partial [Eurytemora carolleeae]|uniref:uncharacterized protein LOC111716238 n=1 Tax=Eurytemora carolleeae TaxID=1294199 RepID=UPI000C780DCB
MTKQSSKQELECSKSSVFSRLGGQEEQEAQQREEEEEEEKELKREKKEIIIKRAKIESDFSYKKETKNYLIKAVKLEKQDKHSAFDRLEKSDSTQECRVSSSVEQELNPSRGILKQRGGQKGLGKSKSASGIISLKPVENVKKKARVSFGENDIRCVSPLPGIKSRLGTFRTGAESEDEMSPVDLRQTLSKSYAKSITAS